jgi:CBS domain containing-hemolysin-like protein
MMMAWLVLAVGVLLAASGTTVAVGAAAVSRVELTRWISRRLRGAAMASALLSSPGRVLRTANAVATIGVLASGLGMAVLLSGLSPVRAVTALMIVGVPVLAGITYGIPRALGRRWCESIVRRSAPWMERISALVNPLLPASQGAELSRVLRLGGAEGFLEPDEATVVSGALAFTRRPVRDLMTPRTEIVAVEEGTALEEVGRIIAESGYSRLPVYRDTLDNIEGMIYAFDLFKVTPGGELPIRPLTVTPGSNPCAALLLEMQRERRHIAVVLDEFGGTAGIVTLEDLLEELVSGIFKEGMARAVTDGAEVIEVDGATPTAEVANRLGIRLPEDAETIGGFLAREASRIPHAGERFTLGAVEFDVLAATSTRIERLAVRRGPVHSTRLAPKEAE